MNKERGGWPKVGWVSGASSLCPQELALVGRDLLLQEQALLFSLLRAFQCLTEGLGKKARYKGKMRELSLAARATPAG